MCVVAWGQSESYRDPRRQENDGESLFGSSLSLLSLIISGENLR